MQAEDTGGKEDPAFRDSEALALISRIAAEYLHWRRQFQDTPEAVGFADFLDQRRLSRGLRKLGRLFARDYPFHNPRYVGHMLSEVSLPSLLGYFAGMLHNDNTVTPEAGPVGAMLEHAACSRVLRMLGYQAPPRLPRRGAPAAAYAQAVARGGYGWSHLTSGGSSANLEALWVARTVRQVSLAVAEVCRTQAWPITVHGPDGTPIDVRALSPREIWLLKPRDAIQLFFDFRKLLAGSAGPDQTAHDPWPVLADSGFAPQNGLSALLRELSPVVFVTPAAHYSIAKSTNLLGFGQHAIRPIPFDRQMRADVIALRGQLLSLKPEEVPLCVVAVAGTTVDGTVDPVHRFAALRTECETRHGLSFWLHADAAYGGYLRSLLRRPKQSAPTISQPAPLALRRADYTADVALDWRKGNTAQALRVLPLADSITCDNHKLGYNPYPSGLIAFRDDRVRAFVSQRAPYITSSCDHECWTPARTVAEEEGIVQAITHEAYGVYTLECSRPGAAASALWLATHTIQLNRDGHGRLLAQTLRAARELYEWLVRWPEVLAAEGLDAAVEFIPIAGRPPDSNVVVFAAKPAGTCSLEVLNSLTRALHRRFQISAEGGEQRHPATQDYWLSKSVYRARDFNAVSLTSFWQRAGIELAAGSEDLRTFEQDGLFALRAAVMNPHCDMVNGGRSLMLQLVEALSRSAHVCLGIPPQAIATPGPGGIETSSVPS
jgi:glutamate/tyrosine decarboxylase-like PLP-dependent enzyme